MIKKYKKIRLEFNEGMLRHADEIRYSWRDSVRELPAQERPKAGYNKHYYELIDMEDNIIKFRLDVEIDNHMDTHITEEDMETILS